jgi:DNA polymerase
VDRTQAYVTNSVKHFKFEPRGKRRLHKTPDPGEVRACRWWLDQERELVKPKVVLAMGATAAGAVFGRTMPILKSRAARCRSDDGEFRRLRAVHLSYLLRLPTRRPRALQRSSRICGAAALASADPSATSSPDFGPR